MHHITAIDYLMSTFGSLTLNLSLLSEKSITPLSTHTRTETLNRVAPPPTRRLRHRSYKHRWCETSSNEAPPAFYLGLGLGTEAVARGDCCLRARMSEVCTAQTVITRARSSISKSSIVQNKADCSSCHGVTVCYVLQLSLCALHA
jgi:hypothetical protein